MKISRRNFLAASGSVLLLPHLQALDEKKNKAPERLIFLGFSYGFTKEFYPEDFGKDYKLTAGLASMEKHKNDFSIVSNLWHKYSREPHGGTVSYLTGADVLGTPGKKFYNSISVDQVAARYMGMDTRYTSLQLSTKERDGHGGGSSLSWDENGNSMSGITSPFGLYNMLFGGEKMTYEQRLAELQRRKSVLDAYVSSIKTVNSRASKMDKERLEQYFQSLREIELRIEKEKLWANKPKPSVSYKVADKKFNGIEEIKTMYDLIVLALQTDLSRVYTYRQPLESLLEAMNINYTGHQLSHYHNSDARKKDAVARQLKQTELFADFITKLKNSKDVDGSRLFDNTVVSYGSNIREGHMLKNVPAFISGNIKGKLKHGQHIQMPEDTPLCNLWLTLLKTLNCPVDSFSDSSGIVDQLLA